MRVHNESTAGVIGAPVRPNARAVDLVVTEAASEVLVYDTAVHHIHHLNHVTALIWRMCDGRRSVDDLVRLARLEMGDGVGEAVVRLALTKLDEANLLEEPLDEAMRVSTTTRRSLVKRAALASAIPAIVSISAPTAATAHSHCVGQNLKLTGGDCNQHGQCCSNVCVQPRPFALGVCT